MQKLVLKQTVTQLAGAAASREAQSPYTQVMTTHSNVSSKPIEGSDAPDIRVLVVDDDADIRELVAGYLGRHGLQVSVAQDAQQMRRELSLHNVSLVLLDIMLPGEDGLSLCRELRATTNPGIIMLTALGEESDRVLGLELGADDYLTKPFSPRELLARIRAVLRRAREPLPVHQLHGPECYEFCGWRLRLDQRELHTAESVLVSLTGGELDLLVAFVRNPGRVLDREQLLELTKGRKAAAFDRSVDVQLSRLRRKLGAQDWIKTVRGGGYLFVPEVTELDRGVS